MDKSQEHIIDAIQTIVIIIAVPLGVIPLIQELFDARQGALFRTIFNEPTGNAQWIIPLAVIVVAAAIVIAVEELPKRRGER